MQNNMQNNIGQIYNNLERGGYKLMKDGKRPVVLIILDGFGINEKDEGNAIKAAHKPNIDEYLKKYPNTIIKCSGMDVGLPHGQMGNSEVGHTNIGAGRIVYQELTRITKSIDEGDFFEKQEFLDAIDNCKKYNSKLHLYGLLSDGEYIVIIPIYMHL